MKGLTTVRSFYIADTAGTQLSGGLSCLYLIYGEVSLTQMYSFHTVFRCPAVYI